MYQQQASLTTLGTTLNARYDAIATKVGALAARFGDMPLPDVLIALTACERPGDFRRP